MRRGDGHFSGGRPWLRALRLVPRTSGVAGPVERERFFEDVGVHLDGSLLKSEVQACGVRLYLLYREIEESLGRDGDLSSFALLVGSKERWVFNWMKGTSGIKQYTLDLLHGWSAILSKHWESEGVRLYLLCHPTGAIEPIVDLDDG